MNCKVYMCIVTALASVQFPHLDPSSLISVSLPQMCYIYKKLKLCYILHIKMLLECFEHFY
jgi:hypothetical protein